MPLTVTALCRAGFEPEAARDLVQAASVARLALSPDPIRSTGLVVATANAADPRRWRDALAAAPPIFARTAVLGIPVTLPGDGSARPPIDRVTPLAEAIDSLAAMAGHAPPWRTVWVEHPDTNHGKALSPLARSLARHLSERLQAQQRIAPQAALRLHVLLAGGTSAFVGTSAAQPSDWPLGIPRLARAGPAPSRSAQKLAEAFLVFLGDEQPSLLRPGMRAVDLGAAPGGWTWQLASRGLRVTAVDNGSLKGEVAQDSLVTHVASDGLRWRPPRPVDWLTCDIAHKPLRIAELVGDWMGQGLARRAIFNLKLPMKRRAETVEACARLIEDRVSAHGRRAELRLRQLYHDREEVTGYLARRD